MKCQSRRYSPDGRRYLNLKVGLAKEIRDSGSTCPPVIGGHTRCARFAHPTFYLCPEDLIIDFGALYMFTGIVETLGKTEQIFHESASQKVIISPEKAFDDLKIGDSIAVSGVCLTVTHFDAVSFEIAAVPETLRCTNLGDLSAGSLVNLERAMTVSSRIGGHYVQGHVDSVGEILEIKKKGDAALFL